MHTGGTSFPVGTKPYIEEIGRLVPLKNGDVRIVLDVGCGMRSPRRGAMDPIMHQHIKIKMETGCWWEILHGMFISSCKRLRIIKGSEARGLVAVAGNNDHNDSGGLSGNF